MAEWTNSAVQTVNPGEAIVFTENPVPCYRGLVLHRDDSGAFLLRAPSNGLITRSCCGKFPSMNFLVDFGANIAIPEGETVGAISVAFELGGSTLQGTNMIVTPAAVEEYFNVSRAPFRFWYRMRMLCSIPDRA